LYLKSWGLLCLVNHCLYIQLTAVFNSQKLADRLSRYLTASIILFVTLDSNAAYTISVLIFQNLLYQSHIIHAIIGAEKEVQSQSSYDQSS
jgi:hypothetical protein